MECRVFRVPGAVLGLPAQELVGVAASRVHPDGKILIIRAVLALRHGLMVLGHLVGEIHQAAVHLRVGAEINGHLPTIEPALLGHLPVDAHHVPGVVAGFHHPLEPQSVGFLLKIPAVLQHGAGAPGHGAHQQRLGQGSSQKDGGQARHQGGDVDVPGLFHGPGHVAGVDVGDFVGQDSHQLSFLFRLADHAGGNEDVAAGHGKGVHGRVVDNKKAVLEGLRPQLSHQPLPQAVQVRSEKRIFHQWHNLLYFKKKLFADLLFFFHRQGAGKLLQEGPGRPRRDQDYTRGQNHNNH